MVMATYGDAETSGPIASVIPLVATSYSVTTTTNSCHNTVSSKQAYDFTQINTGKGILKLEKTKSSC